jgi:hypothetical protein
MYNQARYTNVVRKSPEKAGYFQIIQSEILIPSTMVCTSTVKSIKDVKANICSDFDSPRPVLVQQP